MSCGRCRIQPRSASLTCVLLLLAGLVVGRVAPAAAESPSPPPPPGPSPVVITGDATDLGPVADPPTSPAGDLQRDCGLSARMPDGTVLWVFCDTIDTQPPSFRSSTAAVASAGTPTQLREPLDQNGETFEFVPRTADELAYGTEMDGYVGVWPSAVVADDGGLVTVFYDRYLVTGALQFTRLGSGIAQLQWKPAMATGLVPIVATRVADDIFGVDGPIYGQAATVVDSTISVFGCPSSDDGDCRLAEVPEAAVTDPSAWRFWDESEWVPDPTAATLIDLPGPIDPVGQLTVSWLDAMHAWAMSYSPFPGFTTIAAMRFASELTGPWSEATTIPLPGCEGDFDDSCYAAVIHDELSTSDHIGLTIFDRGVLQLRAVSVPARPTPAGFTAITPTRLADTRLGDPVTRLGPGAIAGVQIAGRAGIPDDATAVVVNLTAVDPAGAGYMTAWPSGTPRPLASNLNPRTGITNANLVTTAIGPDGGIAVFNSQGRTDIVVDVVGWYGRGAGDAFSPVVPTRIADTRRSEPEPRLGPDSSSTLQITGTADVPTDATAVILNVTAADPQDTGFVTLWPAGSGRPLASNLNPRTGETEPNLVTVGLGDRGRVAVYNSNGSTDLVVDVVGWYGPGAEGWFVTAPPGRLLDTRTLGPQARLQPGQTLTSNVVGQVGVPADALAVDTNVTVVAPSSVSYVTVWPAGEDRPLASALNPLPGITDPNAVVGGLGDDGALDIYNDAGSTDLVIDIDGWFVPPLTV